MDDLFISSMKDVTPMMSQYLTVKAQYQDCLLLFRLGDFYELFFDDAKIASSLLNITLTHRGKHQGSDIPMCGIPVATLDTYMARLVQQGQRVVICDQVEDPEIAKERGYKAVIKREVTRVVTSGTLIEDSLLNSAKHNYLMAVTADMDKKSKIKTVSFAVIDISTGDFFLNTVTEREFFSVLDTYAPREILIPSNFESTEFLRLVGEGRDATITTLPASKFNPMMERERLERYFQVATLDGFGDFMPRELAVCGAIVEYLRITQRENFSTLPIPKKLQLGKYLIVDPATCRSLEIIISTGGEFKRSLLGVLDNTVTAFGARELATRVALPLTDMNQLNRRFECVKFFHSQERICKILRDLLRGCPDFERALNRIKFKKFSPRDIGEIRVATHIIEDVRAQLCGADLPWEDEYSLDKVRDFSSLHDLLKRALVDQLPASGNGRVIREGYSKHLDKLAYDLAHSEEIVRDLQDRYIQETGISTLRIKSNNIIGWFIEIPSSQRGKITAKFLHRQTLVNNMRFVTQELMELQSQLEQIGGLFAEEEQKLYGELVSEILNNYDQLSYAVKVLAYIDVYANFATIASERNYVCPTISNEPILQIENGKHPVLMMHEENFTPNDCELSQQNRICLLTGPNMAGKSTYLRQNALMVIMTQIGCYVPATKAHIGIVDRLFSRIGASDDISRGRSTFMVEMIETAAILNQATERSFVILDEVGRGTATYDGLSIAWAVVEHLFNTNKCRVLFATHYGELTALQTSLKNILCRTMKVQEWQGEVIFYHKIIEGSADKSYGLHVASLAGVPKSVIRRAGELLKKFEKQSKKETFDSVQLADQMELVYAPVQDELRARVASIDPNNLTPIEALQLIYELKKM